MNSSSASSSSASSSLQHLPVDARPSLHRAESSDSHIIDLAQFDHAPKQQPAAVTPPTSSAPLKDQPTPVRPSTPLADDFITSANEFMRRIIAVVPPPEAPPLASIRPPAFARRASTAPATPRCQSLSLRPESSGSSDVAPAVNAFKSTASSILPSIPSSFGSWWGGGAGGDGTKKGQHILTETSDQQQRPLSARFTQSLDLGRPYHDQSPKARMPSLLSNFPSIESMDAQASALKSPNFSQQLEDALSSPLSLQQLPHSTSSPPSPSGSSRPTLYQASAASPSFVPPIAPTPPPRARVIDTSTSKARSSATHGKAAPLERGGAPASPQSKKPSIALTTRNGSGPAFLPSPATTATSTSNVILPYMRGPSSRGIGEGSSPWGGFDSHGPPLLHRSATLSSIDSLRTLQTRGIAGQESTRGFSTSGGSWWEQNKKLMDGMLKKEDQGDTQEHEEQQIASRHTPPKNPIVFCHGLFGFDVLGPTSLPPLQISHWRGIREILESNGAEVLITRVPATSSIEERAKILERTIGERYPGRNINLVGHSMGGLDCRFLASRLKPTTFSVATITTISTPHRGSPFADYLIDEIIGRTHLPSLLNLLDVLRLPNQGTGAAFDALAVRTMRQFNEETPDDPNVRYFSWGATFEPSYLNTFKWPHSVIYPIEGPNDGLVSVKSAKWGTYMGTLEGVTHLDLVGWVNTVRYTLSEWAGKPIQFKPASFYLEMADHLAKEGF